MELITPKVLADLLRGIGDADELVGVQVARDCIGEWEYTTIVVRRDTSPDRRKT